MDEDGAPIFFDDEEETEYDYTEPLPEAEGALHYPPSTCFSQPQGSTLMTRTLRSASFMMVLNGGKTVS